MRAERSALNRDTLPFIDLHQERGAQQRVVFAQNCRRLLLLGLLVLLCLCGLLPLTTIVRAYAPLLGVAERDLGLTQQRFQSVSQAQTNLQEPLKHWARFEDTRNARRQNAQTFAALANAMPPTVFVEQIATDAQDKQTTLKLQGRAETMDGLSDFIAALSHRPGFSEVHLTDTTLTSENQKMVLHFRAEATVGK